ncbi:hypothetical protein CbuK_A0024 (plasmid) [Coxiella burnetii CbuK_Q154]|nr:hypothetical protein CbuK_A0024 [Coxiella burnetii CbuK_Q154]
MIVYRSLVLTSEIPVCLKLKPVIPAPSSSPRRRGPSALRAQRAKSAPGLLRGITKFKWKWL